MHTFLITRGRHGLHSQSGLSGTLLFRLTTYLGELSLSVCTSLPGALCQLVAFPCVDLTKEFNLSPAGGHRGCFQSSAAFQTVLLGLPLHVSRSTRVPASLRTPRPCFFDLGFVPTPELGFVISAYC